MANCGTKSMMTESILWLCQQECGLLAHFTAEQEAERTESRAYPPRCHIFRSAPPPEGSGTPKTIPLGTGQFV